MGSMSRMNRCDRFIKEFDVDACSRFDMLDFPYVQSQALSTQDGYDVVRMYYQLEWRGHQEELMQDVVVYDPEEDDDSAVERVCDLLGLEEDEVRERLKKAELIK